MIKPPTQAARIATPAPTPIAVVDAAKIAIWVGLSTPTPWSIPMPVAARCP